MLVKDLRFLSKEAVEIGLNEPITGLRIVSSAVGDDA